MKVNFFKNIFTHKVQNKYFFGSLRITFVRLFAIISEQLLAILYIVTVVVKVAFYFDVQDRRSEVDIPERVIF